MKPPKDDLMDARFGGLKVLVADESPYMITMSNNLLYRFGFSSTRQARSVAQAEKVLRKSSIDLVLCDCMGAEATGLDLTHQIRAGLGATSKLVPILLMTAKADRQTIFGARDAGVTEFIRKPFAAKDLFKKLVAVVDNPRSFVSAEDYFGPDRRRHDTAGTPGGAERRVTEATIIPPQVS